MKTKCSNWVLRHNPLGLHACSEPESGPVAQSLRSGQARSEANDQTEVFKMATMQINVE